MAFNTCQYCVEQHGKIIDISILKNKSSVNAHPNCQCVYVSMRTKQVGTATDWGMEGADAYLAHLGHLPDYYVDKATAKRAGWLTEKKKLSQLFPGKMLGGDVYSTMILNYHQNREEFGMKQILTMVVENEIAKELFIPMTV